MKKNTEISLDINQSVQFHINILQGIIQRMSTNCVSCKAWCLTLVSVQLTLILNNNNPNYTFITILPTFLFSYWMLITFHWKRILENLMMFSFESFTTVC